MSAVGVSNTRVLVPEATPEFVNFVWPTQEFLDTQVFSNSFSDGGCISVTCAATCVVSAHQGRYVAGVNFDCNVYCLHNLLISD